MTEHAELFCFSTCVDYERRRTVIVDFSEARSFPLSLYGWSRGDRRERQDRQAREIVRSPSANTHHIQSELRVLPYPIALFFVLYS